MSFEQYSDAELRQNHDFVMAFEALRRQFGQREMHETALSEVSAATGVEVDALRTCRHLRNALAHGDRVNREALSRYLPLLRNAAGSETKADSEPPAPGFSSRSAPSSAKPTPSLASAPPRVASSVRDKSGTAIRVHAWRDPRLEALMLSSGFVAVGGDEIGDLSEVTDVEVIRRTLLQTMTDRTETAINLFVGYWRRFLFDSDVGDLVVLPTQHHGVAIGEFTGRYRYVESADPHARHRRAVDWLAFGLDRSDFEPELARVLSGRHTVQEFKATDAAQRLRRLV